MTAATWYSIGRLVLFGFWRPLDWRIGPAWERPSWLDGAGLVQFQLTLIGIGMSWTTRQQRDGIRRSTDLAGVIRKENRARRASTKRKRRGEAR